MISDTVKVAISFVLFIAILGLSYGVYHWVSKPARLVDKLTEPDHIINNYEEFQAMYNTTQDICTKIQVLESSKVEAKGFSREERLLNLQNNLSRWVQEYNAKSRMLTKNKWKNPNLPYQLKIDSVCTVSY